MHYRQTRSLLPIASATGRICAAICLAGLCLVSEQALAQIPVVWPIGQPTDIAAEDSAPAATNSSVDSGDDQIGCGAPLYQRPGRVYCFAQRVKETVKSYCWKTTCEAVCIPAIQFPWQKRCHRKCGRIRRVRVLEKVDQESERWTCEWKVCAACCCGEVLPAGEQRTSNTVPEGQQQRQSNRSTFSR